MKKVILSLSLLLCAGGAAMAQHKGNDGHNHAGTAMPAKAEPTKAVTVSSATAATTNNEENMAFSTSEFDFGTVAEGPAAEHEFVFTNKGKEPLLINNVHASCGCTTPSWTKEPIMPGKTGSIKASYNTSGRPGSFTKTITVLSNSGSKVLTIKGTVEKAPETSVPYNTSMLKTN